jgi:hypothetical protein
MARPPKRGGAAGLDLPPPLGCFSTAVGSEASVMRVSRPVTAGEIAELLTFERRLRQRGEEATCAEWVAYLEAKADLFDRIVSDTATLAERRAARRAAEEARDQAERLRDEAADWRWL